MLCSGFPAQSAQSDATARLGDTLFDAGFESFGANTKLCSTLADTSDITQQYPHLAVDSAGNVFSIWQEFSLSAGTGWDIFFSKNTSGLLLSGSYGEIWHSKLRADDTGSGLRDQKYPRLAISGSGSTATLVAVWEDEREVNANIYAARSRDGGSSFYSGGNANLRADDTGNSASRQLNPDVAMAPDGTAHVVWADERGGNFRIFASRLGSTDTAFKANVQVSRYNVPGNPNKAVNGNDLYPSVAIDSRGYIYVAWEYQIIANPALVRLWGDATRTDAQSEIWYTYSTDGGLTWADATLLSLAGGSTHNQNARIAVEKKLGAGSTDYVHVVWDGRFGGANRNIYHARALPNGTAITNSLISRDSVSAYNQINPAISVDNSGNVSVVWRDDRYAPAVGANLMYTRSADRGVTFFEPFKGDDAVQGATNYHIAYPAMATGPQGQTYLAWQDDSKDGSAARKSSATVGNTRGGLYFIWTCGAMIPVPAVAWFGVIDLEKNREVAKIFTWSRAVNSLTDFGKIPEKSAFYLVFNKLIDTTTAGSSSIIVNDSRGTRIPGVMTYDEINLVLDKNGAVVDKESSAVDYSKGESLSKGTVALFTPSGALDYSETYTFNVLGRVPTYPSGVADKLGYGLYQSVNASSSGTWAFSVNLSTKSVKELRITELYNSPNPTYDGITTINYTLHFDASEVQVRIYDSDSRLIRELAGGTGFGRNTMLFDSTDEDGNILSNGVYFYLVKARDGDTGKVVKVWDKLAVIR
jgi:hypothetical protein